MNDRLPSMQHQPLVSICCITYNHENFIKKCIDGLLMQKTDFPVEILIHDDASTDRTPHIVREYANQHPDLIIPIFQAENQFSKGKKINIEFNFPRAKGKYIALCEGDDYWVDPLKLQKQIDFLEDNPDYVMCYHNARIIDENGSIVKESKLPDNLKKDFSRDELIQGKMILTLTLCFRNILKDFPDEFSKVLNADKFLTSLLGNHGKGKYMPDITDAVYRKHSGAIWSSLDKPAQIFENGNTRAWLHRYYKRIGQDQHAQFFKDETIKHFKRVLKRVAEDDGRQHSQLVDTIFSQYNDIIDSAAEEKLRKTLDATQIFINADNKTAVSSISLSNKVSGNNESFPNMELPINIEYMSCNYIENAIAFYYDNLIYTCCYPGYIKDEGILANLSNGILNTNDIVSKKKEIIRRRMRNEFGGCSDCPRFIKKRWRQNWDFKINHVNLNHLLACNLKCIHCGYVDKVGKHQPTQTESIINAIKQLEENALLIPGADFYIGNGEPSINKEMDDLILFLLNKNYKVVVQSNGTVYKDIYTSGINVGKLKLIVTPDAGRKTSYRKIKGRDYFHRVWQNITKYSSGTNGNITVKIILQEGNVNDVEPFLDLCESTKVKNIVVDVDLNIRNCISDKITAAAQQFVEYAKSKNLKIKPGTHWPKEYAEKFNPHPQQELALGHVGKCTESQDPTGADIFTQPPKSDKDIDSDVRRNQSPILGNILDQKGWLYKHDIYNQHFESVTNMRNVAEPAVSIIVISWRLHPDNLKNFQILDKQRDQNFELIFVDNGGEKGEFDPLKPFVDTYVRLNTNTGAYLARNIGSVFAKAPILLFLEDDGIPEHNFVESHLRMHSKYDLIAVRGVYSPKTDTPLNKLATHYYLGDLPYPYPSNLEGNCSYCADVFYAVGGWDDDIVFGYGGRELSIRLLDVEPDQRKQIYSPDPVIYHDFATNEGHLSEKQRKQESSLQRLRKKYSHWDSVTNSWNKFIRRYDLLIERDLPYDTSKIERSMNEGRHAEAINYLNGILSDRPQDASVHNIMGIVFLHKGQKESALDHFLAAVKLEPQNPTYQKNLAGVYVDLNKLKEAIGIYRLVVKSYPEEIDSLMALASFCNLMGRPDEAVHLWEAIVRVDPENTLAVQKLLENDPHRFDNIGKTTYPLKTKTYIASIGKGHLSDALRSYEEGKIDNAKKFLENYINYLKEAIA